MKNNTFQEHYLISNDMVHMAYKADSIYDIVCHYSMEGYEVLSSAFTGFIDEVAPHLPKGYPAVLEIMGCDFTDKEKETIKRAIWNHYHIRLSGIKKADRSALVRMLWFAISFILSGILLFLVDGNTENVLVQYAYLPFWFFGYRLLTYLVIDLSPQLQSRHQAEQIAGMKVIFTGKEVLNEVPVEVADSYAREVFENMKDKDASDYERMVGYYLLEEDGTASISCTVTGLDDVIRSSSVPGYEMLDTELEEYIDRQLPFVPDGANVRLEFAGAMFTEEEKETIYRAVSGYFAFRTERAAKDERACGHRILWFVAFMIAATVLLFTGESVVDKATMEFITMFFWFVGDYLIEFVMLESTEARRNSKTMQGLAKAKIRIL